MRNRGNRAPRGAGSVFVPGRPPGGADRSAQMPTGLPGEGDAVASPGSEAGRRRAIGVVAALPAFPRATTPMVRRWVAGTPMRHGGPEGRGRRQVPQPRQRPGQGPYSNPFPGAMKPTRIGTPPSPAGRRRYKHRSAPGSTLVSWAIEPTLIGNAQGGPMRSAVPGPRAASPPLWLIAVAVAAAVLCRCRCPGNGPGSDPGVKPRQRPDLALTRTDWRLAA